MSGKGFFKINLQQNKIVFDQSVYYGYQLVGTNLVLYFEFDRVKTTIISPDFNEQFDKKLTELLIDTTYISIKGTKNITTKVSTHLQHTKVELDIKPGLEVEGLRYKTARSYLNSLEEWIIRKLFNIEFTDEIGNKVIGNAVLTLEKEGFHKHFYRYDTLYEFTIDGKKVSFKLINAHISSVSSMVRNGDKVYVLDKNNKYLGINMNNGQFLDDDFGFAIHPPHHTNGIISKDRILFEIHAYNDQDMQTKNTINLDTNIALDYGFKLEILPSTIKDLFDGLSTFVDDYQFHDDSTRISENYKLVNGATVFDTEDPVLENEWDKQGASYFYKIETGEKKISDFNQGANASHFNNTNNNISTATYLVDEVFLTYENNKFYFNHDNNYSKTKVFYNSKEV